MDIAFLWVFPTYYTLDTEEMWRFNLNFSCIGLVMYFIP